jgi:hypothetical protein
VIVRALTRIPFVLRVVRWLAGVAVLLVLALVPSPASANLDGGAGWSRATASAYSTADSPGAEGCTGRRLSDRTLAFASLIVPCGARVRFCVRRHCVVATRTDSGPYVGGRTFDLTLGTVRALGFSSASAFGVRAVAWRRVR